MKRPVCTVTTGVVVLALVLSISAVPTAAMQDGDGLFGGESDDDGSVLGDDSGVTAGDDGISIAGDDGVTVGTDGASVGGDEGINASTESVSVAGESVDTDSPGAPGEGGSQVPPDTGDDLPVGPDVGDDQPAVPGPGDDQPAVPGLGDETPTTPAIGDSAPGLSTIIGSDGIYDTEDSDLNLSRVDVLGPLPNTGENSETAEDTLGASTDDLPVGSDRIPADALPTEQSPGPEALPVGSDSQVDCAKPIAADDLPAQAVPYIDDLPVQPPNVPLVPTRVTTPANMAGLAFSFSPDQCEIYDPDDPTVDPTDPPTDPSGKVSTAHLDKDDDSALYFRKSEGRLEEGGPAWDGLMLLIADRERVRAVEELQITDGRTENYAGVDSDTRLQRDMDRSSAEYTVFIPGAGGLSTGYECGNVPESEVDPLDDPTATCQVDQPTPEVITPGKVVDVITNPPEYDYPDIEAERLPVDL